MGKDERFEKLFNQETYEKKTMGGKRTTSKRSGRRGKVVTAHDFMNREEKLKYQKSSEVKIYMYIPTLEELKNMPYDQASKNFK